jgi:DNA-directed RNA polymerase sigma subunit (sigma70/sigma32)
MKENELKNKACFKVHQILKKKCSNKTCRYWQNNLSDNNNCIINKSNNNTHTLQEIGDLFDITRMRVCQIEKNAIKKASKACLK